MFIPHSYDKGKPGPFEYKEVTANETVALGEALVLSSGKLTKCGATAKPTFIAMKAVASAPAGTIIPVIRVSSDTLYETELSADYSAIAVGASVTIASDGLRATATTTNGVFTIDSWDGKSSGDKVRGRF